MKRLSDVVTGLEPPQQFSELHRHTVSRMQELETLRMTNGGGLDALESRAVSMHTIRTELVRLLDALEANSGDPYVTRLKCALKDYIHEDTDTLVMVEEPLRRRGESLERIKPPQRWRDKHERYVTTFADYLAAVRDYHTTVRGESLAETRRAAKKMCIRHEELAEFTEKYPQELSEMYAGQR